MDAAKDPSSVGSWWSFLTGLVPNNFFAIGSKTTVTTEAAGDGFASTATTSLSFNILQLLVVAVAIGIAVESSSRFWQPRHYRGDSRCRPIHPES